MLSLAVFALFLSMCEQTCHLYRFASISAPPLLTLLFLNLPICLSCHLQLPRLSGVHGPGLLWGALPYQHSKYLLLSSSILMPFTAPPPFLTFPDFVVPGPLPPSNLWFLFGNSRIWVSESSQSVRGAGNCVWAAHGCYKINVKLTSGYSSMGGRTLRNMELSRCFGEPTCECKWFYINR